MFVPAVVVILARFYGIGRLQQLLGNGPVGRQLVDGSFHAIELARCSSDNNGPPRESPEREDDDESPRAPRTTEPVETERDNAQPLSSSSTTTGPLRSSEPQAPDVLGSQWGEITQHW